MMGGGKTIAVSDASKPAAKVKAKSAKAKAPSAAAASKGGKYVSLVVEAIKALKIRGGASRQKISAFVKENHPDSDDTQVKLALKRGVVSGALTQHGQSFRVGGKSSTSTTPKAKATKPKTAKATTPKKKSPAVKKSAPKPKKAASKKSTKSSTKSPKKAASKKKASSTKKSTK